MPNRPEFDLQTIRSWENSAGDYPDRMYGSPLVYLDRMGGALCYRCVTLIKGTPMEAIEARLATRDEQVRCSCGRSIT